MNFRALKKNSVKESSLGDPKQYAVRAIQGFFRSISFGHTSYDVTKDVLRLLNIWFAQVRRHSSQLVYEADMVSRELILVAILWNELWHGALEEVSKHFFNNRDVAAMIAEMATLHEQMDQIGIEETPTLREVAFYQAFDRDIKYAKEWTNVYERTKSLDDLNKAWNIYYHVLSIIRDQLANLFTLELDRAIGTVYNVQ
ncbi:hypothetical protein PsorP6_018830 [Peronosclerospora sorghi]|nr:hypothetical protein PsorP6_018830 [Peronosclerospora sorghi]